MKKLIGLILFLISLPVVAQDEKWIIESIPYFSVPATGDMDSDNYMILPKDYYQSEEFLGLLERAYMCLLLTTKQRLDALRIAALNLSRNKDL